MKTTTFICILFLTLLLNITANSQTSNITANGQNVAITDDDSYMADSSAMLDIKSTNKGVLIPRMDYDSIPSNPAIGLLVYVTANGPEGDNCFYYYDGLDWNKIGTAFTETDPTYTASQAANITATDITNLGNLSGVNTGDQDLSALDGSETKVTAGTNVSITGTGTTGNPYVINSTCGVLAFAEFYALMPSDNAATVAVGAAILFPQDGPSSGTITRLSPSEFQLSDIGIYMVSWQVSIDEPGQLALELNDVQIPYTVVGRTTSTTQITGNSLITTTSLNSTLSVISSSGNITALTITPNAGGTDPVSASLVIMRIQ